jgi:hypothetical protein
VERTIDRLARIRRAPRPSAGLCHRSAPGIL